MSDLKLGSLSISDIKLGITQVEKVYFGTELVWSGESNLVTLTIQVVYPSDATVVLTAQGYEQQGNSITVEPGTDVDIVVSRTGYLSITQTMTINETSTMSVSLIPLDYTLTISPTPNDSTVTLTASGYSQVGNTITVPYGTTVSYSVSHTGYTTESGTYTVTEDYTLPIALTTLDYTLTVSPVPSDATVVLTAQGYTQSGNTITVPYGTEVSYSVSKTDYVTQSGEYTVTADYTLSVELDTLYHVDVEDYQYLVLDNNKIQLTKYIGQGTTPKVPGLQ